MRNSFTLFLLFFFYFTNNALAIEKIVYLDLDYILSNSNKGKEILIPINDDFIMDLDRINKMMNLKIPEGLLKIYM